MQRNGIIILLKCTLLFACILSCSSPIEKPISEVFYKLELKIDNVGYTKDGLTVLVDKPLYTLDLESNGVIDYLSFNSCSTVITKDGPDSIFKRKKTTINFRPNEIEKDENCDVTIYVTEKGKQRHTFGHILFRSKKFELPGHLVCGQESGERTGVSACQMLEGNLLRIKFDQQVSAYSYCGIKEHSQVFDIKALPGFCNYYFQINDKKHRLLVYGWSQRLLN